MPSIDLVVAAATAVVNYDLFTTYPEYQTSNVGRVITGAVLQGSAAAGDTEVQLKVGSLVCLDMINPTTGGPNNDYLQPCNIGVPAGARLSAKVIDAAATNPIYLRLTYEEVYG